MPANWKGLCTSIIPVLCLSVCVCVRVCVHVCVHVFTCMCVNRLCVYRLCSVGCSLLRSRGALVHREHIGLIFSKTVKQGKAVVEPK